VKRLFLAVMLCVGVLVVPVASASAAETVACTFKGPVTFPGKPLTPVPTAGTKYKFEAAAGGLGVPNECVGSVAGKKKVEEAVVEGEGELACTVSKGGLVGVAGLEASAFTAGHLKVEGRAKFELTLFKFFGVGAQVTFEVEGNNKAAGGNETLKATGSANFVKNPEAVAECVKKTLTTLNFEAQAAGETF
jgi:hypothetical protein